ncbi:MAG: PH domain-containing protein [Deltaproteobacteria bacterium]|nr:PH domain-containing protein [Deltaproteobacteria bacterium]
MDNNQKTGSVLIDKMVKDAFGVRDNANIFNDHGLPIRYYFYPTWRSRVLQLFLFFLTSYLSVRLSNEFPDLVIRGQLFVIGNTEFILNLPILMFIPGTILGSILLYMYNCRYIIDERGVEAQVGLVALHLRQLRLKYEDIRGVEAVQSLWERFLSIGTVEVGSAMTEGIEISMIGVADPRSVQILIGNERDKRIKNLSIGNTRKKGKSALVNVVTGD